MKLKARPLALAVLAVSAATALPASWATSQGEREDKLGDTRTALEEYIELRKVISKERRDWKEGRESLEGQVELLQRQIDKLREEIAKAEEDAGKLAVTRDELRAEDRVLEQASGVLADRVTGMEQRLLALLQRVPEPLRLRVEPMSQSFPDDPENTEETLSNRFGFLVAVINNVGKFNRQISPANELRDLPDGSTAEVDVIYLGIGQGYYATPAGDRAAVGSSGPDGWVWTPADEHAEEISRAIAIYNNEDVADFVSLPLTVQ